MLAMLRRPCFTEGNRNRSQIHRAGTSSQPKRIQMACTNSQALSFLSIVILSRLIGKHMVFWIFWETVEAFLMLFSSLARFLRNLSKHMLSKMRLQTCSPEKEKTPQAMRMNLKTSFLCVKTKSKWQKRSSKTLWRSKRLSLANIHFSFSGLLLFSIERRRKSEHCKLLKVWSTKN